MATDIEITGLAELKKQLEKLPANIEKNITRGALRAGAKVFQDRAKELCPVGKTGNLKNSIKIKTSAKNGKISAQVVAGDKKAYYVHMVEGGTIAHMIAPKKSKSLFVAGLLRQLVDHPGAKRQPFMRPAFDEKQRESLDATAAYLKKRIPRELKKASA